MSQFYTDKERKSLIYELDQARGKPQAIDRLRRAAQNEQTCIGLNDLLRASERERKELRALLYEVLDEADDLLDRVNSLLSYAGSIADDETHGPAVTKARARLGKDGV